MKEKMEKKRSECMTNFEKIKENLTYERFKNGWSMCGLIQEYRGVKCANVSCMKCQKWLQEEYQEPVLDKVEKEYLSAVIKPFRDRVRDIEKLKFATGDLEQICIAIYCERDIFLPAFDEGIMYKGMELNKEYTLKELGL